MAKPPNLLTDVMVAARDCRRLASEARQLPVLRTPDDYYRGWSTEGYWGARLPDNVLLFSVISRDRLAEAPVKDYHHRHVLVVPLQGTAIVEVDAAAYEMRPGRVLLIRPFQLHDYHHIRGRAFCWLFVTFELAAGLEGWDRGPRQLRRDGHGLLTSLVRWRRRHPEVAAPANIRQSASLALMLLLMRIAAQPDTGEALSARPLADDPWLDAVLAKIHSTRGGRPTLAELSRETGVSASHLRALFRARFGVSLGRYLRDYHIKRSIGMLSSSSATVTQVAELCGYGSVYSFSRAFRRTMGCSPVQYLRRMRR